jgi:hypothetical protein
MKYLSSKYIIARVMREFRLKQISTEMSNIHEWIGEAVEMIGTTAPYIKKSTPNEGDRGALTVSSHRVGLPCDFVRLISVEYNGQNLMSSSDISGYGLPKHKRTTSMGNLGGTSVGRDGNLIYEDGEVVSSKDISSRRLGSTGDYYQINGPYLQTSFEEGHVKLHYMAMHTDDCGLPYIIDEPLYKRAIVWYVITMLLAHGYKHPVFSYEYADSKWEEFMPRAQNEIKAPSKADMHRFKNMWVRLIPNMTLPEDFMAGSESMENIDI